MDDYISREAEIQFFNDWVDDLDKQINDSVNYPHLRSDYKVCKTQLLDCVHAIKKMPSADVRPVVRAHWEWDENGIDWSLGVWKCSHCHCKAETWWATKKSSPLHCAGSHFCGNCGADMR